MKKQDFDIDGFIAKLDTFSIKPVKQNQEAMENWGKIYKGYCKQHKSIVIKIVVTTTNVDLFISNGHVEWDNYFYRNIDLQRTVAHINILVPIFNTLRIKKLWINCTTK